MQLVSSKPSHLPAQDSRARLSATVEGSGRHLIRPAARINRPHVDDVKEVGAGGVEDVCSAVWRGKT